MAPPIRRVQSQEVINVSQDFSSDPILKNTPPRSASSPITIDAEPETEDRVEDSLTDDYLNGKKLPQALSGHKVEDPFKSVPEAVGGDTLFKGMNAAESSRWQPSARGSRDSKPLPGVHANDRSDGVCKTHRDGPSRTGAKTAQAATISPEQLDRIHDETQTVAVHLYSSATAGIDRAEVVAPTQDEQVIEEDLYGATPRRRSQSSIPRLHERPDIASAPPVYASRQLLAPDVPASETLCSRQSPPQLVRQPAFERLEMTASTKSSLAESAIPDPASMASGSKALASTGKLQSAGSALVALHARKQQILGRSRGASAKLFGTDATKEGPSTNLAGVRTRQVGSPVKGPPGALKVKDTMTDAAASLKHTTDTFKTRTLPKRPPQTEPADRKRKLGPEKVAGEGCTASAFNRANKRAKGAVRNGNDPPANSTQPDSFPELSEALGDLGPNKATKKCAGESGAKFAKDAVKTVLPASKRDSTTRRGGTHKAVDVNNAGEGRQLRPRKPMQQLPIDDEQSEQTDIDDVLSSNHAEKLDTGMSVTEIPVQRHADNKHISWPNGESDDDTHMAGTEVNHERPPVVAASTEPTMASPDNIKPPGSQFNAIVLSDLSDLSSSIDQDSPPPDIMPVKSNNRIARLETPAAMEYSPPRAFSRAGSQSLRGTGRSRKTQIIKFDKSGPLNQGSIPKSWDSRVFIPPPTVPVNWGSPSGKVIDIARKKPSSVATSIRSGKSNIAAPPSNVAPDVHNALAGLSKSRPQVASNTLITTSTVQVSAFPNRRGDSKHCIDQQNVEYGADDSGFNTMNDLERFVNSPSPDQQLNAELEHVPTTSQVVMPPPKSKLKSPKKAAGSVSNSATTSRCSPPTISEVIQQETRTAMSYVGPKIRPKIPPVVLNAAPSLRISPAAIKSDGKRSVPIEISADRPEKRIKASGSTNIPAATHAAHAANTNVKQPSEFTAARILMNPVAFTNDTRTATTTMKPPAKRTKALEGMIVEPDNAYVEMAATGRSTRPTMITRAQVISAEPRPTSKESHPADYPANFLPFDKVTSPDRPAQVQQHNRTRLKQSRYPSQTSQTVDINGSPVPADMEITAMSTVLGKFSQQPDESPDTAWQSPRFKTSMDGINAAEKDAYSLPPSYQQPLNLSSNAKALPGPSGSSSKTIRHVRLSKIESDVFMDKWMKPNLPSDPFALPGEFRSNTLPSKYKQHLLERIIDFAHGIGEFAAIGRVQAEGSNMECPQKVPSTLNPIKSNTAKHTDPGGAPEYGSKFASDLDKQIAAIREHTAFTRATEEDPDKTLVNDCSQETEISKDTLSTSSTASSVDAASDLVDESEPSLQSDDDEDDLRMWRKGLKLHQLGLYEELVKIARVVTAYVTAQESSAEAMIDENYRRELIMIEQEEEVQKLQYKQYMVNLGQKKKEKIRELFNLDKVLQGVLDASAVCWEEHCKGRAEKERGNRKLDGLISSWS